MENHRSHNEIKAETVSSPFKWILICLAVGAALLLAIMVFKIPVNTVATGALFLACPLLHIFMMKNGNHKH